MTLGLHRALLLGPSEKSLNHNGSPFVSLPWNQPFFFVINRFISQGVLTVARKQPKSCKGMVRTLRASEWMMAPRASFATFQAWLANINLLLGITELVVLK